MAIIRDEAPAEAGAREMLLDRAMGPGRRRKTCERLREGRLPAEGLALSAVEDGRLVGTVRLWDVTAGAGRPALMLGPLAVDPELHGGGLGSALMREALARAKHLGHRAVVLVGDAPYYARFGFSAARTAGLWLPGPFQRERFMGLDLADGALDGAAGPVAAAGRLERGFGLAA